MSNTYNNIPYATVTQPDATVQAFDNYYSAPLEMNSNTFNAMKSFFTSKGFDALSAESIAVTIMKQAVKDKYNPMTILDTLKGLSSIDISALVSEILNNNRFKTSYLGYSLAFNPQAEVVRNIVA